MRDLSILIVTFERADLLEKALNSLLVAVQCARKKYSDFEVETNLCINGQDKVTLNRLARFETISTLNMHVERIDKSITPAAARNLLLRREQGRFIFFMDDDIELPPDILLNFVQMSTDEPSIDVWGGPNLSPLNSSRCKQDNGWLVSQELIIGPIAWRYKKTRHRLQKGSQFNLMLCNLFISRDAMNSKKFGEFFKTAEENELIYQLDRQGCKMKSSDRLFVWHERRENYFKFLKQIFFYGYGRGQLFYQEPIRNQKFFIFFPILFLLLLLAIFNVPWIICVWLGVIKMLYIYRFRRWNNFILVLPIFIWVFYFLGLVTGLKRMLTSVSEFDCAKV